MSGTNATRGQAGIAVIGMSARFPQADTLTEFRANLRAGRDSVRAMPPGRVEACCQDPSADYPQQGYLDRIDLFDHEFFGLSRREAEVTDPQHRLALQLTREALENAGYAASRMRDSRTAVIFSSPTNGYAPLVREVGTLSMIGNIPCGLPARVSHLFGFTGPCYGVDTGCNGSLVAVHQASRELRDGDADFAVVGGASVRHVVPPAATVGAFPGIASPTAKCRAFDEDADGAAAGEGGAVLLLTTLERALEEGSFIHAVIRGSAVVHNGRHSATIATPSAKSQAEVIRKAWRSAGLDIATAGYVEAHGSGTRLGDAVEVEGLALARSGAAGAAGDLPIGSVKTNLGHLDHAAGIAGLVKTVLSVRHAELYPTLHFTRPAEDVDLKAARLDVVTSGRSWKGDVRRAGVSSFSLGGINAHCVVEQPPAPDGREPARGEAPPQLIGVSARSAEDLVTLCERLSLELRDHSWPLADVARTLNEGRDHHGHRMSVVARTVPDLALKLAAQVTWRRLEASPAPDGEAPASASGLETPGRAGAGSLAPRVVLLLSGDATGTPAGEGAPLPEQLPLPSGPASRVRGQLAAHARLKDAGVRVEGLISSGVSRYAVRHLQGRLTAADTQELQGVRNGWTGDGDAHGNGTGNGTGNGAGDGVFGGPLRSDRLHAAVEEQLAAGPVVFVELATRGEISDRLAEHLDGRTDARVITLGEGPEGVLEALGALYEARLDLDWTALRPTAPEPGPRRVPLPGHPFRGVRCWARPLGDIIRFDAPGTAPQQSGSAAEQPPSATAPGPATPGRDADPAPEPPAASSTPAAPRASAPAPLPAPGTEPADSAPTVPGAAQGEPAAAAVTPDGPGHPAGTRAARHAPSQAPAAPAAPGPATGGAAEGSPPPVGADVLPWLRRTLAELLYADEVAPDADYFSIGGNSVIALQLIERVISRYGAPLKLVDIYAHPLVSDLAAAVADRMPQPAGDPEERPAADGSVAAASAADVHRLPPIRPGQEPTLSYGQERMWFHHQLDPDTTLYNLPGASRLRGEPDLEALRLAWEDLAQRHEALRSNFAEVDGRPQLVVRPELGDFFRVLDVSGEEDPEAAARAAVQKETHWVFDVAHDPLVRVTVVRIAPGDHLFCWTMHHGVNDGWAPQILMGELLQFYEARCEGRVHRPEPLPVQYSDYARWQRDLLEGSLLDGELDYWREQLREPPALELPTDRPRAARMDFAGATHGFTVPAELVGKLRAMGSSETATLFMVILTGLNVLLSRWSGQRDIVIGTPTIGRSRPELWGLLGFFNNTIALRSDLSGDATFRELLRRVRAVVLGAMEHQEIPFDRVVREVAPDRDPSRNPIFDVMYVHQTLPPDFSFGESTFNPGRPGGEEDETPLFPGLPPGTAKFDLTVVVAERPDVEELEVAVEYSTQLFDAGTVTAMTRSLLDLLWAAADDADVDHLELPAGAPAKPESGERGAAGRSTPSPASAVDPAAPAPAPARDRAPAPAAAPAPPPAPEGVSACLRLRGDVDPDVLRAAFDDLTERHDVLRARFPVPVEQPLSPFARDGAAGFLGVADVSGRTNPQAAARELAAAHGRTAIDPATGSPLRALLLTTGTAEHILVVTTHREVYDGAQPGVFFGDLLTFYAARSGHLTPGPAALPVSYNDYARWQHSLRADGLLDGQLAHWQERLASLKAFETPTDRPRPMRGTHASASHEFRIPAPLAGEVIRDGARERLLAGITALLTLRSGADEVVVGLTESAPDTDSPHLRGSGADRPPLGELLGPFANPLALRIDTADEPGLDALTARVREVIAAAEGNADVPFEDVVRALRLPRQPGRAPLFDVTYAHHALPPALGAASGLDVRGVRWPGSHAARLMVPAEDGTSAHDLAWSVLEGDEPGALSVSVEYRTELFEAGTVAAMAGDLVTLLRLGLREPAVPLSDLWPAATPPHAGPHAG
ncbi:condensation domain-containing protein [Streptomyces sp. WMMB 322]|uniref:condensation domain-containing protein n=1 Tax=Streptomyces sp. WMMB 322 TaxID=1286821 RepID=UPI0006E22FC6|nr:condensation domain-containing protein [Streptomyces sp. WMMB 322]SCK46269.1 Phosphopantetheine attachment site [Streptomyces sp. WMMB 322]